MNWQESFEIFCSHFEVACAMWRENRALNVGRRRKSVGHSKLWFWVEAGLLMDYYFFLPSRKKVNINFQVQTLSSDRENNIVVFEKDESTVLLLLVPFKFCNCDLQFLKCF